MLASIHTTWNDLLFHIKASVFEQKQIQLDIPQQAKLLGLFCKDQFPILFSSKDGDCSPVKRVAIRLFSPIQLNEINVISTPSQ